LVVTAHQPQALALRARVVLLAAEGLDDTEIAQRLGVDQSMVREWRGRFVEDRLDGLSDERRPGQSRKITDEKVQEGDRQNAGEQPGMRRTCRRGRCLGRWGCRGRRFRRSGGHSGSSHTGRFLEAFQ
jgi:transposase